MVKVKSVSHSVVSYSLRLHRLQPARLLCPWDSPGKNTGEGCHALLQGIFPIQGKNTGLLHCRQILYHLSHQGSMVGDSEERRKRFMRDALVRILVSFMGLHIPTSLFSSPFCHSPFFLFLLCILSFLPSFLPTIPPSFLHVPFSLYIITPISRTFPPSSM